MVSPLSVIALGFLLGLQHATDADHIAAVTTSVSQERTVRRAARLGALWGVGHSITILLVGGAIIAFRLVVPPRVGLGLEFGVALMLIGLGLANLRPRTADAARSEETTTRRPIFIGIVHGLAGSAAVAILALSAIRETWQAVAYLAVFGLGTIAGMMLVTALIAAPALYAAASVRRAHGGIRLAAGALSIVVGLLLARELIVDGGLFSAVPTWDPH
jgi:cytochrome c biogenesis protein CcdA